MSAPPASLRLRLLNALLRVTIKPGLARATDPVPMRARMDRTARRFFRVPPGIALRGLTLDRADGSALPVERLVPDAAVPGRRILYLHGGAFLTGSPRSHRHVAARLAIEARAETWVPDYRLAPEHPFPAALDDARMAYRHMLQAGAAPRLTAFVGDSAGGGLAFGLLVGLDGLPPPSAMAAFSPWVDLTGRAGAVLRNARRDAMLPAARLREVAEIYLQGTPADDPRASPALARFRDPPDTLIFASDDEILADDAGRLVSQLRADGGRALLEHWPRMPHAWPYFAGVIPEADRAVALTGAFLDDVFRRSERTPLPGASADGAGRRP